MKTQITKAEVNDLPLGKFEGEIIVVDNIKKTAAAIKDIERENIIAVDTKRLSFDF